MVIHSVAPRLWPTACSRAAALLNVVVMCTPRISSCRCAGRSELGQVRGWKDVWFISPLHGVRYACLPVGYCGPSVAMDGNREPTGTYSRRVRSSPPASAQPPEHRQHSDNGSGLLRTD